MTLNNVWGAGQSFQQIYGYDEKGKSAFSRPGVKNSVATPCHGEVDAPTNIKIRKRMEGAAAAERMISGDNSSAQVDTDLIRLTSFGDDSTGPPALPCSEDDALVDKGAAAPKLVSLTHEDAHTNSR